MDMLTKLGLVDLFTKLRDKRIIDDKAFIVLKELLFSETGAKSLDAYKFLLTDLEDGFIQNNMKSFSESGIVEHYNVKGDVCILKLDKKEIKRLFKEYKIKSDIIFRLKNLLVGKNVLMTKTYIVLEELFKKVKYKPNYYRYASIMFIFTKQDFEPNFNLIITDEIAQSKYGLKNAEVLYSYLVPKMNKALKLVGYKLISKKVAEKGHVVLNMTNIEEF